jgi:hypothetical protein
VFGVWGGGRCWLIRGELGIGVGVSVGVAGWDDIYHWAKDGHGWEALMVANLYAN